MSTSPQRTAVLLVGILVSSARAQSDVTPSFEYDPAAETIAAVMLDDELRYDADVASTREGLWLTWLRYVPEQGDQLWVGLRREGSWVFQRRVTQRPGEYARPTLTRDATGLMQLSYEARVDDRWDVFVRSHEKDGQFTDARRVSDGAGADIYHRVAADPQGGLWFVWQSAVDGQFDVLARHVTTDGVEPPIVIGNATFSDWHPDIVVTPRGQVTVAWDSYDGESYNILARSRVEGRWQATTTVSASPAFEGWVRTAADPQSNVWLAWEEGGANWGKAYRSRMNAEHQGYLEISDQRGPLHRLRKLHVARLDADGSVRRLATPLPMPALTKARQREGRWPGVAEVGAFYERAKLAFDGAGRLWVVYRHQYVPWLGVKHLHHLDEGWNLYARYLEGDRWSKLYRFTIGQDDGMQRLSISPQKDGIALAWTAGRTDRRESDRPRGVAVATLNVPGGVAARPALVKVQSTGSPRDAIERPTTPSATVGGRRYDLYFGDLHRHTDLSLCFVPADGTIDDAYRFAIDAASFDFFGITDHTRDIALGDGLSQLWWRCRKQVTRYHLPPRFVPFFSYERSRGDTDHNVISLRPDMLRPHTYPLPEFWRELDDDTFTIPHQPFNRVLWETHDNARRPLLEIFQGCRDVVVDADAHAGLDRGYLFGFIASSDHLSTHASYACVWAERRERESIFRAMQARRTFGATDRIMLLVRAGDHWMGERFTAKVHPTLTIQAEGTAAIETVDIFIDGKLHHTLRPGRQLIDLTYRPESLGTANHYIYVRLQQTDGHQAWASPMWVKVRR